MVTTITSTQHTEKNKFGAKKLFSGGLFYHSFYWWLVNLTNEPERIEWGEAGPDINQAVVGQNQLQLRLKSSLCLSGALSLFWRIHKTSFTVCDNIYIYVGGGD